MLRRRTGIAVAAAAVTALGVTTLPSIAGAAESTPTDKAAESAVEGIAPGMLKALERDLGLTADQARTRIANEADAFKAERTLRKELGADFAGSWLSGKTSTLTVATTDRAEAAAIERAGAKAEVVQHSVKSLEKTAKQLDKAINVKDAKVAPVWYVDVRSNSVVVLSGKPAEARKLVDAAGVDASAVRVVKSDEQPRTFYDVVGGDAYYMGSGGRCSVGFSVRQGGTPGFATAGHCGTTGTSTRGYNQVAQGTFRASVFPGGDGAWVAVNSNWTPRPFVRGTSSRVSGSQQAPVGSTVCRSGSTTGWHCGTIQQHGTSVTYPQGRVNNVTRTSVCAEPGDSGGSFISGTQAQGVTSGGSGNCRTGGTTYYQPINPILNTWNLTLVTS
ncbi:S1 family peptidase [Streptomyces alkaliterrae]|uniref:S1 family peptidase n=1 Tax=Streptomyces alkaliterrae TaxID=2213162 RepID=A0A5P0YQ56_9ACTN|nr:S1 family peptidase [Streptomyces alkaliterrae]MBB1251901.1 S1 family peptidase [Streptomyces alkaliterrae]MBB1257710.1 S1 family peptidase [Streptomyces alkaliterrae]MQS00649.1 S1 family peptidase [Streptomyces alkaliterrae]